jgi:hypothetical protein
MKYLLLAVFVLTCSGCQYFAYQESCEDNPDQASCAGMNTQQPAGTTHRR